MTAVWDVVRVPFPYTNRPVRQHRPAVVVAVHKGAETPPLLWVLMVTSAQNRGWAGDVVVSDLTAAGLPTASLIRTKKIATIEARDAQSIGRLALPDQHLVTAELTASSRQWRSPGTKE